MTEKQQAFDLANAVLDKPHIDPDGDIAMLARQFLRAREEIDAMRAALTKVSIWLKNNHWGTIKYMEGTGVYQDKDEISASIEAVLANFTVPGGSTKMNRAEIVARVLHELGVLLAAGLEAKARGGETLPEVIARRRQMGFSPRLEETMARPWVCPHCGSETTILSGAISLNIGGPDDSLPQCNACEKEGIAPVTGKITVTRQ